MTKPESYGITPRQIHANRNVWEASYVVLGSFGIMVRQGEFKAATTHLIKAGQKPLNDLLASQKMLLERCIKLSGENDALKMMYSSVIDERKDQEQNIKFTRRLLDKIQTLEN